MKKFPKKMKKRRKVLYLEFSEKNIKKFKYIGKNQAFLPWENLRNQNSKTNGNFTDIIKEEILALSKVI